MKRPSKCQSLNYLLLYAKREQAAIAEVATRVDVAIAQSVVPIRQLVGTNLFF